MTTGVQLRFVGEAALTSRVIGWFSAGHLSHVDVPIPPGTYPQRPDTGGTYFSAYEGRAGGKPAGCQFRSAGYVTPLRTALITLPTTSAQAAAFYAFLLAQEGKRYDWLAILGFLFGRNWRSASRWICSEVAEAATVAPKIIRPLLLPANKMTPTSYATTLSVLPDAIVALSGSWPEQCVARFAKLQKEAV